MLRLINNYYHLLIVIMKFCSFCGQTLLNKSIPHGDNKERFICQACGTIHYQNPKNIVGTVSYDEKKVLMCKRAIQPRRGLWTLPAGFMECGETIEDCARRETLEEANAIVTIERLFSIQSIPQINQVHFFYIAKLNEKKYYPGVESEAVALFEEEEIPWDQIAFFTIKIALKKYFDDLRKGKFQLHSGSINRIPKENLCISMNYI